MERITREEMLMGVAEVVARRGTCSRAQVGVVFAREGRILATGYNGAPRGIPHCTHESFTFPTRHELEHGDSWYHEIPDWAMEMVKTNLHENMYENIESRVWYWDGQTASTSPGCTVVEHAERNAIAFAAREGIRLGGSDAYCTHAPCADCARALLGTGIKSLTYVTPYRLKAGVELLHNAGITVLRVQPDGPPMDYRFAPSN